MKDNQKEIKFVPAVCPKCGANLNLDPNLKSAFCQYCGTQIIVDRAINEYHIRNTTVNNNTTVNQNVRIGPKGAIESLTDYAADKEKHKEELEKQQKEKNAKIIRLVWKLALSIFVSFCITQGLFNAFQISNSQHTVEYLIALISFASALYISLISLINYIKDVGKCK